jgi:single-stranded DNA-specific DHH superfamily exonuclease
MSEMNLIDIFNGDADGLCALMQWRRVYPAKAELISGVKRDNALLHRVKSGVNADLLVLDINFENNRADVVRLLADGANIRYFDHHYPGERIEHPSLNLTVDESADVCTSLLVHRALGGKQAAWAIVGAFGDNLPAVAEALAKAQGYADEQVAILHRLGELLNYNGYGSELSDLHFDPVELFRALYIYGDPFTFVAEAEAYRHLADGHAADMAAAAALADIGPQDQNERAVVYVMPDQAWARRAIGVWANALSQHDRQRAHLILCPDGQGAYTASVRSAQRHPYGAASFCRQFPRGGGRESAGGITGLSEAGVDPVIANFLSGFAVE